MKEEPSLTLGSRINRLRTEKKLSQGELAEALGVSRQSISKWETDSSVPELDKLMKLSRLFGVTLDELVTGEPAAKQTLPEPPTAAAPAHGSRMIVGVILLCMGFLAALLLALAGGLLEGLVVMLPFAICGVICLTVKRRTGLWCAWVAYLTVELYLRWATGITWRLTLWTFRFEPEMNYMRLLIGWVQLLVMLLMMVATVRSLGREPLTLTGRVKCGLVLGAASFALTWLPNLPLLAALHWSVVQTVMALARLVLLTAALTVLTRLRTGHRQA